MAVVVGAGGTGEVGGFTGAVVVGAGGTGEVEDVTGVVGVVVVVGVVEVVVEVTGAAVSEVAGDVDSEDTWFVGDGVAGLNFW